MEFYTKLERLMDENEYSVGRLAECLNINASVIYSWKNDHSLPNYDTAIRIANLFDCSLDFLFGEVDEDYGTKFKKTLPFGQILRKNLKTYKISQYRLVKDKVCTFGNLALYFKGESTPNISTVKKLADYFNLSLDEFVGRV